MEPAVTDAPDWPQMEKGRPVAGTWRQPPGQPKPPAAAEPRPGDPTVLDASLLPGVPVVPAEPVVAAEPAGPPRSCADCGGAVDADGYCTQCGAKAPSERDRFEETPAAWVAGVCDRGLRHARNEDALATFAEEAANSRAVLVVCDGVTSSDDSDVASLAAARAARDVLAEGRPEALGTPASRNAAVSALFARAAAVANDAVAAHTRAGAVNPAACTFVGALVTGNVLAVGNVGDSRAYWLPDGGEGRLLSRDDSLAGESIAAGTPRKEAEDAADAHTITRWLGIDAQDVVPHVTTMNVPGPGWVLVCSDGLWNYASEPAALGRVLADAVAAGPGPVAVARALVAFALAQGGHDNISACLARVGLVPEPPGAAEVRDGEVPTSKLPAPGAARSAGPTPEASEDAGAPTPEEAAEGPASGAAPEASEDYDPITHQAAPRPAGSTAPLEG
nr:serine/threonine protein phosphatase [Propionibacterium sp.]